MSRAGAYRAGDERSVRFPSVGVWSLKLKNFGKRFFQKSDAIVLNTFYSYKLDNSKTFLLLLISLSNYFLMTEIIIPKIYISAFLGKVPEID